jgi:hypothetical protein
MPVTSGQTFECGTGISVQKLTEGGERVFGQSEMTGQLRIELEVQVFFFKNFSCLLSGFRNTPNYAVGDASFLSNPPKKMKISAGRVGMTPVGYMDQTAMLSDLVGVST